MNFHKNYSDAGIDDKLISEFLTFSVSAFPPSSNFFRVNDNSIAIILAEKLLRDVLPTVKGICDQVGVKKVWLDGMVEDFNINCGLVQFPEMGDKSGELLEKVTKAMSKAVETGPNTSALYESLQL
ncbi:MAG: hypothetical protein GWN01_10085 [Nitrosopumilaceae archaeon]|nr:hypothetical protein [Nitrosopumilaceae archaeon]NIV66037.1 hypothetical protein [Nitrosopumilaceae archaeon]NIX61852.1 hypothetical protein [Nitrosopumilaceae archaeon]